jgi:hypothetical protein
MMQLLVKDHSTQIGNTYYKLLLYSINGHGKDFFGVAPKNLHKDEEALKKIEGYTKLMLKFNVYIDAIVMRKNGFFMITDTKIELPN